MGKLAGAWCSAGAILSPVRLCNPRTLARQAPLTTGFSRQEYWSGLPFPAAGDLPDPKMESAFLGSPASAGERFTTPHVPEGSVPTHSSFLKPIFFPISHLLVCSFLALVSATLSVVSLFIFLLGLICCLSDSVLAHPQQSFKSMDKTYFACLHTCIHLDMPAAGLGFIISKPAALWPLTNSLDFFGLGKDITFNIHPFLEGRQKFIPIVLP